MKKLPLVLLLSIGLAGTVQAGPREEIAAAVTRWAAAFVSDEPAEILALYAPDAVLWGTLSPTVRRGPAALREYFDAAYEVLPGHRVAFGEQHIRVYGDTAINTGHYTFSYASGDEPRTLPARFSFVYVRTDRGWLIVDHHSSALPGASLPASSQ